MILALLGCVDLFYPGRVWSCDEWERVDLVAPGALVVRDAGPDEACRVGAYGRRFPRHIDGIFDTVEQAEVVGTRVLAGSWGADVPEVADDEELDEGAPRPPFGLTDIQLTDRDEDDRFLDLVRIQAAPNTTGTFTWSRTGVSTSLWVECDRCTVRAREVDVVELNLKDAASSAWVCGGDELLVSSSLRGLIGYHDIQPIWGEDEEPPDQLFAFDERPAECLR